MMRYSNTMKRILIILLVLLFAALSVSAQLNEKRLNSAPQAFRAFFSEFRRAIEKRDKMQVAAVTRFPLRYGFDAGDEGTMSRAQFLKRFKEIFGNSPRDFMPEKNPKFSRGDAGEYVVSTESAEHLIFIKTKRTFKFISYLAEP